ncbi:hypothetical protein WP1_046 [Pseudomonas phage WP1]
MEFEQVEPPVLNEFDPAFPQIVRLMGYRFSLFLMLICWIWAPSAIRYLRPQNRYIIA